jgi:hypothetical protein
MCDGTNHNLKVIYVDNFSDHARVVRWCTDCGAVVVDIDVDGRTNPGGKMKMKFPKYRTKDDK